MSQLDLFVPCMPHKGQGDEKEDECATYSTSIGDELLWVLFKHDYYDDWYRDYDTPYSFYNAAIVLHYT